MPVIAGVTTSQRRVLAEFMCDGASNAQIAERLGLDVETVKSHISAVLAVSGCHSRAELAIKLMRRQVVLRNLRTRHERTAA